jgi:cytochrome c-type biogenesis protein CcmH/NrfF
MLVAFVLVLPAVSSALSASQATLNFMCPCGSCDEALSTCECPSSDGFRSQIAGMVGRGYTMDQITQDFVGRFGPSVLIANAAIAPNAVKSPFNKKIFGSLLVIGGFTLAVFTIGRQMGKSSVPQSARGRSSNRPRKKKRSGNKTQGNSRRFREGIDEDLLDD